jgi:hypothetical protein
MSSNLSHTAAAAADAVIASYKEVESLRLENIELQEENTRLRFENASLRISVDTKRTIIQMTKAELNATETRLTIQKASVERALEQSRAELQAVKKQLAETKQAIENFVKIDAKLEAKNKELGDAKERLMISEDLIPAKYLKAMKQVESIKELLVCPISHVTLSDPVCAPSGVTYSKSYIHRWLSNKLTDPCTRTQLFRRDLYPDRLAAQILQALDK